VLARRGREGVGGVTGVATRRRAAIGHGGGGDQITNSNGVTGMNGTFELQRPERGIDVLGGKRQPCEQLRQRHLDPDLAWPADRHLRRRESPTAGRDGCHRRPAPAAAHFGPSPAAARLRGRCSLPQQHRGSSTTPRTGPRHQEANHGNAPSKAHPAIGPDNQLPATWRSRSTASAARPALFQATRPSQMVGSLNF